MGVVSHQDIPALQPRNKEVSASTATKFFSGTEMEDLGRNVVEQLRRANKRLGSTL